MVLLPENGSRLLSLTYVHDLVEAIMAGLQGRGEGMALNAISEPRASIGAIVREAADLLERAPQFKNLEHSALEKLGHRQWVDIPLWIQSANRRPDARRSHFQ